LVKHIWNGYDSGCFPLNQDIKITGLIAKMLTIIRKSFCAAN